MPGMPVSAAVDRRHLRAAADWFLLLTEDGTPETRQRWQLWHDAADEHRHAWQKVERLQGLLAAAPRETRKVLGPEAVDGTRKPRRRFLATLGVALAAAGGYTLLPPAAQPVPVTWVATARGERRTVQLPDGGHIVLGSDTRIGIAYGPAARDIRLERGVLQLASGSDAQGRPLRITARDGVVEPLGTRFTMAVFATHTELAVQEHAVRVLPASGAPTRVAAGQRVTFDTNACGKPQAASAAEDAWTRGLVTALDMPLRDFAARFALHAGQPIDVAPALAQRPVSGTFRLDAPERSLRTLAGVLAIRLERDGTGWRLVPR